MHVTRGWRLPWGVAVTHGEVQPAEVRCQPRHSQASTSLNVSPRGLPQSATAPVFSRGVPKLRLVHYTYFTTYLNTYITKTYIPT